MRFVATILIITAALAILLAWIGNSLPTPYRSYVPMVVGNDIVREQMVREYPMKEANRGCLALLGDSRVAFNLEAKRIVDSTNPDCRAQNYGFPALGVMHFIPILDELRDIGIEPEVAFNEAMLTEDKGPLQPTSPVRTWEYDIRDWLMRQKWARWVYLGHHRSPIFCGIVWDCP